MVPVFLYIGRGPMSFKAPCRSGRRWFGYVVIDMRGWGRAELLAEIEGGGVGNTWRCYSLFWAGSGAGASGLKFLTKRFDPLSDSIEECVAAASEGQLSDWGDKRLTASRPEDWSGEPIR